MAHRGSGRKSRGLRQDLTDESFVLFFEKSPIPLYLFERKSLRIRAANEAALALYGYSRAEMLRMKATDIRPPEEKAAFARAVRSMPAPGIRRPVPGVWSHIGKGGRRLTVTITATRARFQGCDCVLASVQDVGEVVGMREQLSDFRERWREVIENAPDYITTLDRRGRVTSINRVEPGARKEDVLGRLAWSWVKDPAKRREYRAALRRVFTRGETVLIQVEGVTALGAVWFENRIAPVRVDGRVTKAVCVSTDISEKRKIEKVLSEFREMWLGVIENATDYIWTVDRKGKILTINRVREGLERAQVVGSSVWNWFVKPKDRRTFREAVRTVFERGHPATVSCRFNYPDGPLAFENRLAPIREGGKVVSAVVVSTEIEQKMRVESQFEESRQLLDSVLANAPDYIMSIDRAGRIGFINRVAGNVDVVGRTIYELASPESRPAMRRAVDAVFRTGKTHHYEASSNNTGQGQLHWRASVGAIVKKGRVMSAILIARDVTEEKSGEDALKRAQARFRGMFEHSRDGMNFVARDGKILEVNPAMCRMLGYTREELMKKTFHDLTPPEWHEADQQAWRHIESTKEAIEFEKEYVRKEGRRIPVSLTAFLVPGAEAGGAAIVRDNTERRRLEREILQTGAREQSQLGRELHDSLGQELTGISLLAQSLARALDKQSSPLAEQARRVSDEARVAVEEVRALAAGLMPAELLPNGLPAALDALRARGERLFGLQIDLRCDKDVGRLEDVSLIHLYRIAQEAVTNAAKHARARKVTINLTRRKTRLELGVSDDGVGIKSEGAGLGLKIMRQRCLTLGGTFAIRSKPGGGTTIVCSVPFVL